MKIKYKFNKDKLWFGADFHFCHDNIIKYCNRPFKDVQEMNEQLIKNWNKLLQEDDDIIIAGDFIHSGNLEVINNLISRLNGRMWLVYGNHDYQNRLDRLIVQHALYHTSDALDFEVADDELEDGRMRFHITHYPCEYWTRRAVHLFGHIHSGPLSTASEILSFKPMRYDIGVDANDFKPISYEQIKVIITKQLLRDEKG